MPSPKPPRTLSLRDFDSPNSGTWRPKRRAASDLAPRAKQLIELMVLGLPDGSRVGMTLAEAAKVMSVKVSTAREYQHRPAARAYFLQLCAALREGELPANIRAAIAVRDDKKLQGSAAGSRAIIEAAKYIENGGKDNAGININVGVGVGVAGSIAPGYTVAISEEYMDDMRRTLRRAGSTASVLSSEGPETPAREIEGEAMEVDPVPPRRAAPSAEAPAFGRRPFEPVPPHDSRLRLPTSATATDESL